MPTYSALTTLPGEDAAQSLAAAMERMDPEPTGVGVFEIEDGSGLWEVGGYFLEPPDEVMLEVLATAFGAKPFALSELPEVDWVAHVRRELSPVDAGRFFVFGSHDADKVPAGRVPVSTAPGANSPCSSISIGAFSSPENSCSKLSATVTSSVRT